MSDDGVKEIVFQAALFHTGQCFSLDAEGSAKLILSVPTSEVRPLAEAMAEGRLIERAFVVRIELGGA